MAIPHVRAKVARALRAAKREALAGLKRHVNALGKADKPKDENKPSVDDIVTGISLADLSLMGNVQSDLGDVAADSGQQFVAELSVTGEDELFGQVSERALAFARDRAAELVTDIDESTRNMLRDVIAGGIEDNVGLSGIIDRIDELGIFDEARADLIARTEVANANSEGVLAGMFEAQKIGVKLMKFWIPDELACDICLENGDAGPIPVDEEFPSGDLAPLAHPNCQCSLGSEVEEQ